ncbi:MAG TPA: FkbM family methyltransferase [Acidimicrobiales bacterium]|nr:FkbM family methyltransferase [Acidimicrobiales bacterium]
MSSVAFGVGDPEQVFLWRYLRPGDVLVDVGANIGTYSALALARGAKVEAFEPDDQASAVLGENLRRNGSEWKLHRTALADTEGDAPFSASLDISNRLLPAMTSEGSMSEASVTVPVTRLDTLRSSGELWAPTVLKTDAEGFDFQVLAGAEDTIRDSRPVVISEIWEGGVEVRSLLERHGYVIFQVNDRTGTPVPCHGGDVSEGNIVAIPTEQWNNVTERLQEHALVSLRHKVTWERSRQ